MIAQLIVTIAVALGTVAINQWIGIKTKFAIDEKKAMELYRDTFFRITNAILAVLCFALLAVELSSSDPMSRFSVVILMIPLLVLSHQYWILKYLAIRTESYELHRSHIDVTDKLVSTLSKKFE
jgi:NhaP-type Na+/H+ or K+/H+ antiporter